MKKFQLKINELNIQKGFTLLTVFLSSLLFGSFPAIAVSGDLDTNFGNSGKVLTQIGNSTYANAVAIQSDGKIIVGGSHLLRYNANGSLDPTFDLDGYVTLDFNASAVIVQSDGKIVAAGTLYTGSTPDFALARYNTNGSLDTTFNGDGRVITSVGIGDDILYGMTIQA